MHVASKYAFTGDFCAVDWRKYGGSADQEQFWDEWIPVCVLSDCWNECEIEKWLFYLFIYLASLRVCMRVFMLLSSLLWYGYNHCYYVVIFNNIIIIIITLNIMTKIDTYHQYVITLSSWSSPSSPIWFLVSLAPPYFLPSNHYHHHHNHHYHHYWHAASA